MVSGGRIYSKTDPLGRICSKINSLGETLRTLDGVTLVPWLCGRGLAWDFIVPDTYMYTIVFDIALHNHMAEHRWR